MKRSKPLLHGSPVLILEICVYDIQIQSFPTGAGYGRGLNRKNAKICSEFFGAEFFSSNRRQYNESLF